MLSCRRWLLPNCCWIAAVEEKLEEKEEKEVEDEEEEAEEENNCDKI